jgi:hypothetical protein
MTDTGLSEEYWKPERETYSPFPEEVQEIHIEIVKDRFPNQDTLNQYPNIQFSLPYKKHDSWPEISIDNQNPSGRRKIGIYLYSIDPAKILEYEIDTEGKVFLTDNPTDSQDKRQFENRIDGLRKSLDVATKRNILGQFASSKHEDFS